MDRSWIPTVAGVLEIVAAICAFVGSLILAFVGVVISEVPDLQHDPDVPLEILTGLMATLSALVFLGAVVSLVGGIAALRRRSWYWALAGAIAALFVMTPAGVVALVLVVVGEREFGVQRSAS